MTTTKKKAPATRPAPTHVRDLVADPKNRRKHNPRNLGMVVDALHQVGAARSIVIDEANVILAGNGVTEAAAEAGITKVQVVEADGQTLVAVRRRGLTDDQKRALAIYDNRSAELAGWDLDQLRADQEAGLDLATFFHDDELEALLAADRAPDEGDGAGGGGANPIVGGEAGVIVICADEAEQQRVYEDLTARGLNCRVVNT